MEEDVLVVLYRHQVRDPARIQKATDLVFDEAEHIEDAALSEFSMYAQTAAAFSAIEDILLEAGVLQGDKHFVVD